MIPPSNAAFWRAVVAAAEQLAGGGGWPRSRAQVERDEARRQDPLYDEDVAAPIVGYEALERAGLAERAGIVTRRGVERVHFVPARR